MKRTIIIITVLAINCGLAFSQTIFDALKIAETDINGTARYTSMAGAFGALGGDPSAIKDNPAGLGVYRKSELSATGDILMQTSASTWNTQKASDNLYNVGTNNFTLVFASPTWRSESQLNGLLSSNFSFSYNKLKNFNRNINIRGKESGSSMTDYFAQFTTGLTENDLRQVGDYEPFDNGKVPWMSILAYEGYLMYESQASNIVWGSLLSDNEKVNPSYSLSEQGKVDEYSLAWSGNFSNKVFLGASLNFQSIYYKSISQYNEVFEKGGNMNLVNNLTMKGAGFNFNIGAIVIPVDFIRLGLSLHTPMTYTLSSSNNFKVNYDTEKIGYLNSPYGNTDFKIQSPLQMNVSTAFIIERKGLISAEYVLTNYNGMKLSDIEGNSQDYEEDNTDMNNMFNNARTIKIGGEYKVSDNLSLRAGFANTSSKTRTDATKNMFPSTIRTDTEYFLHNSTNYFTGGIGYRESGWYIDFGVMRRINNEDYMAYNSSILSENLALTPANVITKNNNLVLTFGLRF